MGSPGEKLVRCMVTIPGVPGQPRVPVEMTQEACYAMREGQRVGGAIKREQDTEERRAEALRRQEELRLKREADAAIRAQEVEARRQGQSGAQQDKARANSPEGALDRIEGILRDVLPIHMRIQPDQKSELVDFMQKSLQAMGYSSVANGTSAQGMASRDFLADLNGFLLTKSKENGYGGLAPLTDVREISGHHLQAIIDSMRDQKVLTGSTPSWKTELAQGLKEIDNTNLIKEATKLDPNLGKRAAIDNVDTGVVLAQNTDPAIKTTGMRV